MLTDPINPFEPRKTLKEIRAVRDVIVKGRQVGMTTFLCATLFIRAFTSRNHLVMLVAQSDKSIERIFEMIKCFWRYMPEELKDGETVKTSNRKELIWRKNESGLIVSSAGSMADTRGITPRDALCTEVAYYTRPEELFGGLKNSIPDDGNLWMESTSAGEGNYYAEAWEKTQEAGALRRGIFFSWAMHDEYSIPTSNLKNYPPLSKDDISEAIDWGLTEEQQVWRKWKIADLDDDIEVFDREFPLTAAMAFASTSTSVFDGKAINYQRENKSDRLEQAAFDLPINFRNKDIYVWKNPVKDRRYLITCDVSQGLNEGLDRDYSVLDVWDCITWEQVCQIRERYELDDFSFLINEMYRIYNNALVAVESNNHGHAILTSLVDIYGIPKMGDDMNYGLYLHDINYWGDRNKQNLPENLIKRRLGWDTNTRTKVLAITHLNLALRDKSIKINSDVTLKELITYVLLKRGKMGAVGKNHDDTVTAAAIAAAILSIKPSSLNYSPVYIVNEKPYTQTRQEYSSLGLPTVVNNISLPN